MTESTLLRVLLARLNAIPGCDCWRANAGVAKRRGGYVRFGVPGQGDISGILVGGRRLEVECKTERGQQSDAQRAFQARIESKGGLYILARDIEPTLRMVRDALHLR